MNDITFLIQGKLNTTSISSVENYLKYTDNIVFSFYEEDDIFLQEILDYVINKYKKNIKVVKNKTPEEKPYNSQNIFLQGFTTLKGLENVDTKFCIKLRSDEKYENFDTFIKTLYENPQKYNTINLFFRKDKYYKFHPSDHMIGCDTQLMKNTFNNLMSDTIKKEQLPAEVKIFLAFLKSKNINPDEKKSAMITRENCTITNLSKFNNFIIKYNGANSRDPNNYSNSITLTEKNLNKIENEVISTNTLEGI
jgi:hypothetical protein